jgi:hypothetical protein
VAQSGQERSGSPSPNGTQTQLLEMADALMERARTMAEQTDQLIAALDAAARQLVESGQGVAAAPLQVPMKLRNGANGDHPKPAEPDQSEGAPAASISQGTRMLVTQMALDGTSHEQIAKRLGDEFGVEDPEEALARLGL